MNRTSFYACLMMLIGAVSLANCTPSSSRPAQSIHSIAAKPTTRFEPGKVNWMGHWLGEDQREQLVREVASEFEFENPGIEVNLQFHQEILGVRSKVETARLIVEMIQTGNYEWDIIWMDTNIYALVAEQLDDPNWGQEYLVDFTTVDGFRDSQKAFILYDPAYREQTGGILVGPYIEGYYYAIYFNQDVAARIGLDIATHGMTYQDLLGYVQQVYRYNQTHATDIAAFYESSDWTTLEILFQHLVKSAIGDFDAVRASDASAEKQAALLRTLRAFEELSRYTPVIPSYRDNLWFDTRDLVLQDNCLFYINGTWMYNHWRAIADDMLAKMIPAELPVFQEVDFYLGGYIPVWAVFKDAPNRDVAVRLLMYWAQPDVAERWVAYTKNPTGIAGNLASATLGSDPYEEFQDTITGRYDGRVAYTTNLGYLLGEEHELLQPVLNELLLQILTGHISADDAYERLIDATR